MYCNACGAEIADTAKFCTECGTAVHPAPAAPVIDTAPAAPAAPSIPKPPAVPARRYRARLVFAVIACVLWFLPTGLAATVFAAKAIRLSDAGEAAAAAKQAKRATVLTVLSLLFCILWHLLGLFLLIRKYG